MAWAEVWAAGAQFLESVKGLCTSDITTLDIPTKWEQRSPRRIVVECPSCAKSYDLTGKIPPWSGQATVTCTWCQEAMEIYVAQRGTVNAVWRQRNQA